VTGDPRKPEQTRETDTADFGNLPVDRLPPDAPDLGSAAVDTPPRQSLDEVAHDPDADRGARAVAEAYATALTKGLAADAADLHAEHAAIFTTDEQLNGRRAVLDWHEALFRRGGLRASAEDWGNDTARLNVDGPSGPWTVELSFDASGRIGTARWLRPETAALPEEERIRKAL